MRAAAGTVFHPLFLARMVTSPERVTKWLLLMVVAFSAGAEAPAPRENFVSFLAGVRLLQASHRLDRTAEGTYYRTLLGATGVSTEQALAFARSYRRKPPRKWQAVVEAAKVELESLTPESSEAGDED